MKSLFPAVLSAIGLATLCVGVLLPTCAQAQGDTQVTTAQGLYDKPSRLRDLTDLGLLKGTDLSPAQKTEVLLSWLAAERRTPSPTTQGLGGGPITTNYIQAQMVKVLALWGDPTAVAWVASSPLLTDEGVRDCMKLVLAFLGDQSQIPALEKILRDNPNPDLRAIAAGDLGALGSLSSIPVLELALTDTYSLTFIGEGDGGKMTTRYPVRQAVEQILKVLKDPILLAKEKKYNQPFAARAAAARKHPPVWPLTAEHFVSIANGGAIVNKVGNGG